MYVCVCVCVCVACKLATYATQHTCVGSEVSYPLSHRSQLDGFPRLNFLDLSGNNSLSVRSKAVESLK